MTKKTKKYYRDLIAKDYNSAVSAFTEAIVKYGDKCSTRGWREVDISHVPNGQNGEIIGFSYVKKKLYVDVYWQGDSTDGEDSVLFDRNGVCLDAYWDDDLGEVVHGDVNFNSQHLYAAIKKFSDQYLN